MAGILSPKIDIIFKKLFSDIRNKEIIQAFTASVLDIPYDSIKEISIENTELLPEDYGEKSGSVDLNLTVNNKKVDVEIQVIRDQSYIKRVLYYWSKLYINDFKAGELYNRLKETISVNILDFNQFDCREYYSEFALYEKNRQEKLTDVMELKFFELKKLENAANTDSDKYLWMKFINSKTEEEFKMLEARKNTHINEAIVVLKEMSADEKLRRMAEMREKAINDKVSQLAGAKAEGEAIGIAKGEAIGIAKGEAIGIAKGEAIGIAKGRADTIRELYNNGMSLDQISEFLRISVDELTELLTNQDVNNNDTEIR